MREIVVAAKIRELECLEEGGNNNSTRNNNVDIDNDMQICYENGYGGKSERKGQEMKRKRRIEVHIWREPRKNKLTMKQRF